MPYRYTNKLAGQRVLIVGGTSGIGFSVAENALEHGATVLVASSKPASVEKATERLLTAYSDARDRVEGYTVNLLASDTEGEIVNLLQESTNNGEKLLDHIVITAGTMPEFISPDQFETAKLIEAQQLRVVAPLLFAKRAPGRYLRSSNRSSITVTAGNNRPSKGWLLPTLLRGAMEGMVRALAVDLQPIRVNIVLPGATETEFFSTKMSAEQMAAFKESFKQEFLTGVIAKPEDVSEAYLHILKDANLTGHTLYSDGGILLAPGARK